MNMEAGAFHQHNQLLQFEAMDVEFVHRLVIFEIRECETGDDAYQNSKDCGVEVG